MHSVELLLQKEKHTKLNLCRDRSGSLVMFLPRELFVIQKPEMIRGHGTETLLILLRRAGHTKLGKKQIREAVGETAAELTHIQPTFLPPSCSGHLLGHRRGTATSPTKYRLQEL